MGRAWAVVAILALAMAPSVRLLVRCIDLPNFGFFHDDALYYVSAKALAEGDEYRVASLPDQPYQTKYTPLFPLILSVAWKLAPQFPENLSVAAVLAYLPLPLLVGLFFVYLLQMGTRLRLAVALTAGFAVNPWVGYLANSLLAEVWLALFTLGAVVAAERASRDPGRRPWMAVVAGAAASLAFLTRTAGLFLLVSVPLVFLLKRRGRAAGLFLATMLPVVAWWTWWSWAHRSAGQDWVSLYYLDYGRYYLKSVTLADLPVLFHQNIDYFIRSIADLLIYEMGETYIGMFLARPIGIAALIGAWRAARRSGQWQFPAFAAVQAGVLMVWNFPANPRFLVVLMPLLFHGLWTELEQLGGVVAKAARAERRGQRVAAVVMGTVLAGVCGGVLYRTLEGWRRLDFNAEHHRAIRSASLPVYGWIAANLPQGARIHADRDPVLYLYTGAVGCSVVIPPTVFYRGKREEMVRWFDEFAEFVRRQGLDHVLLTPNDFERYSEDGLHRARVRRELGKGGYEKIWERGGYAVYRVEGEKQGERLY